ncbi:MAG: WecB/TagA/CpsF family glycosyltransferase [Rhizobiaceae bacterium]|nr:WecB/TagA/CpsF family glycosyltransferase [Rhizobiaceae bacterium]
MRQRDSLPRRDILGVPVVAIGWDEALDFVASHVERGEFLRLGWLNANNANMMFDRPDYRSALDEFVILPDGVGVDIASWILHGSAFPANLNGTDLTPALLQRVGKPMRVALMGSRLPVCEMTAASFREIAPQHDYRVIVDGFFKPEEQEGVLKAIADYRPDMLLVAMGVPRQEIFIARAVTPAHCTVAIAVGALFDLHTGVVPRASMPMRKLRLEWLSRLLHEPRRLWRRYIIGNPQFLMRVFAARFGGRKGKNAPL